MFGFKHSKLTAVLLSLMMASSAFVMPASAVDIEVDLGPLFGDEDTTKPDDGNKDDGKKDDGKKDESNPGDAGDGENGGSTTPSKPSRPGSGNSGNSGNKGNSGNSGNSGTSDDGKKDEPVYNSTFSDVAQDSWYYEYVTPLAAKGIIAGYPDGTFLPQNNITRAEFLKLLVECMGYQTVNADVFDDVKNTDENWFYSVVSTANANGLISVDEYGKELKPNEKIGRTEVAALLVKALGIETGKYQTPYKDTDDKNIIAVYSACIMQGTKDDKTGDRYFYPDTNITRAETSAVFTRLLEYKADPAKFVQEKIAEYGIVLRPVEEIPQPLGKE